jgi:hypothetical protein
MTMYTACDDRKNNYPLLARDSTHNPDGENGVQ